MHPQTSHNSSTSQTFLERKKDAPIMGRTSLDFSFDGCPRPRLAEFILIDDPCSDRCQHKFVRFDPGDVEVTQKECKDHRFGSQKPWRKLLKRFAQISGIS
jgi:hypothetical protein